MRYAMALNRAGRGAAVVSLALLGASCGVLPGGPSSPSTSSAPTPEPSASVAPTSSGSTSPAASVTGTPPPGPSATGGPSATAGPALASRTFTVKGTYSSTKLTMRFDVVELKRRGDLLDLRAGLTSLAQDQSQDQRWQVAGRFSGAYRNDLVVTDGAFAGSVLTDTGGKKRYLVAADSAGACVCTVGLTSTFIDAGDTVELNATYAAPPASTSILDVTVPSLGTFRDLPIS